MNIWEKLEKGAKIERKDARESVCGVDYWILPEPDGTRTLSPYHCGTCDECLERKGFEIRTLVSSMAYLNDIKTIKAPPSVISVITRDLPSGDYARFPSSDGFDYLFFVSDSGVDFFDMQEKINWSNVASRRDGTRKSGRLFYLKKSITSKDELEITLRSLRASSLEGAEKALEKAVKFFAKSDMNSRELKKESEVAVYNNTVTMKISQLLEDSGDYVFTSDRRRWYNLPIFFELKVERK